MKNCNTRMMAQSAASCYPKTCICIRVCLFASIRGRKFVNQRFSTTRKSQRGIFSRKGAKIVNSDFAPSRLCVSFLSDFLYTRFFAKATILYYRTKQESWIDEFLTANTKSRFSLASIGVHWRPFAVLLVRLYPIEIDFDDSKWWCSPRSVSEAPLPQPLSPKNRSEFGPSKVCSWPNFWGEGS